MCAHSPTARADSASANTRDHQILFTFSLFFLFPSLIHPFLSSFYKFPPPFYQFPQDDFTSVKEIRCETAYLHRIPSFLVAKNPVTVLSDSNFIFYLSFKSILFLFVAGESCENLNWKVSPLSLYIFFFGKK